MDVSSAPMVTIPQVAAKLSRLGVSVIPIRSMEDKEPALASWRPFIDKAATPEEVAHWFTANGKPAAPGMAIVCGQVSGGLTVIDFDTGPNGTTLFDQWACFVEEMVPGITDDLPIVSTPSGGTHVYFRSEETEGNTKLAMWPNHRVAIETRGEGGYVVAPPSPGYCLLRGRVSEVPALSAGQKMLLLNAARSLTQVAPPPLHRLAVGDALPGDAYNAASTVESVTALLAHHGWTATRQAGETMHLARPGKDKGTSATVTLIGGMPVFYCFSGNAHPIPEGQGLSPFALLTYLEHGGDYSAAARALGMDKRYGNGNGTHAAPKTAGSAAGTEPEKVFNWREHVRPIKELLAEEIPEVPFIVPGIIAPGLTLLAGAPKTGKSLMAWGIAVGVAQGGYVLGSVKVEQRPVVYLAMEDGKRLLQKRLKRILEQQEVPEELYYTTNWPRFGHGGVEMLHQVLDEHPTALIIIDTYETLRSAPTGQGDAYRQDYSALEPVAKMCNERHASVVVVHHTKKTPDSDFVAQVSGSFGLSGVAASIGVLHRTRLERQCTLSLCGREYDEETELAIGYDPVTLAHTLLGSAEEVAPTHMQNQILDALRGADEDLTPKQVAAAIGNDCTRSVQTLLSRMLERGQVVQHTWGKYRAAVVSHNTDSLHSLHSLQPTLQCTEPVVTAVTTVGSVGSVGSVAHTKQLGPDYATSVAVEPVDKALAAVKWAVQGQPCAGCKRTYTKRDSQRVQNTLRCDVCGTEVSYLA